MSGSQYLSEILAGDGVYFRVEVFCATLLIINKTVVKQKFEIPSYVYDEMRMEKFALFNGRKTICLSNNNE
jgi:hypothetical protein